MATITRRRIENTIEKRIVTGLIVSKKFCGSVVKAIDFEYFLNDHMKTIAKWSVEYYKTYGNAPSNHIQDIFDKKKEKIKEEDAEIIEKVLMELSERYEFQECNINPEYLIDRTFEYFEKRELEIVSGNMQMLLAKGDVKGAEKERKNRKNIALELVKFINPFSKESIMEMFEDTEPLVKFPGDLGRFVGGFEKHWFIGVVGPFKRGKTWILQEIAIESMLARKKTVFFSLEMPARQMNKRIAQRLLAMPKRTGGRYTIPCFDCLLNQDGTCKKSERRSKVNLRKPDQPLPTITPPGYQVCTYCRGTKDYLECTWSKVIDKPDFEPPYVINSLSEFDKRFGNTIRVICYPRFSANTSDIVKALGRLEQEEDFVPEVIIIDYADILKPEDNRAASIGVEQVDLTWKSLAKLAGERHALVVTGSQATREALESEQVRQKHMSLWIGKLAHVDVMMSLNQTPEEKRAGVMRIGVMAHRHEDFNEEASCTVLQNLYLGQAYLDSYWEG